MPGLIWFYFYNNFDKKQKKKGLLNAFNCLSTSTNCNFILYVQF